MVQPICPPVLEAYRHSIMDVMTLSITLFIRSLYGAMFIQSSNRITLIRVRQKGLDHCFLGLYAMCRHNQETPVKLLAPN